MKVARSDIPVSDEEKTLVRNFDERRLVEVHRQHENWGEHKQWASDYGTNEWWGKKRSMWSIELVLIAGLKADVDIWESVKPDFTKDFGQEEWEDSEFF